MAVRLEYGKTDRAGEKARTGVESRGRCLNDGQICRRTQVRRYRLRRSGAVLSRTAICREAGRWGGSASGASRERQAWVTGMERERNMIGGQRDFGCVREVMNRWELVSELGSTVCMTVRIDALVDPWGG
nr:hypothetical protein Iba_chr12cCG12130 [Ipomoea batatas]